MRAMKSIFIKKYYIWGGTASVVWLLECSPRVWYILGSSPNWVKPKTMKLVFVASPISWKIPEFALDNNHSLTHLRGVMHVYCFIGGNNQEVELGWGMSIYHQRFNNIEAVSIIGGRNRNPWRKHWSGAKHWIRLSHKVLSITTRNGGYRMLADMEGTDCIYICLWHVYIKMPICWWVVYQRHNGSFIGSKTYFVDPYERSNTLSSNVYSAKCHKQKFRWIILET